MTAVVHHSAARQRPRRFACGKKPTAGGEWTWRTDWHEVTCKACVRARGPQWRQRELGLKPPAASQRGAEVGTVDRPGRPWGHKVEAFRPYADQVALIDDTADRLGCSRSGALRVLLDAAALEGRVEAVTGDEASAALVPGRRVVAKQGGARVPEAGTPVELLIVDRETQFGKLQLALRWPSGRTAWRPAEDYLLA